MAGASSKKKNPEEKTFFAPRRQSRPAWALLLLCLGVLALVAMLSYVPEQSSQVAAGVSAPQNLVGEYGAEFSTWTLWVFGYVAWVLPLLLLWTACLLFFKRAQKVRWLFLCGVLGLFISLCGIFTMASRNAAGAPERHQEVSVSYDQFVEPGMAAPAASSGLPYGPGGRLGQWSYNDVFIQYIGPFGNGLFLVLLFCISAALLFPEPIVYFWRYMQSQWHGWREQRRLRKTMILEARQKMKEDRAREKILAKEARRAQKAVVSTATQPLAGQRQPAQAAATGRAGGAGFSRDSEAFPAATAPKRGFFSRLFGRSKAAPAELVEQRPPLKPAPVASVATSAAPVTAVQPAGTAAQSAAAASAAAAAVVTPPLTAKRLQAKSEPSISAGDPGIRLSRDDAFTVPLEDAAFADEDDELTAFDDDTAADLAADTDIDEYEEPEIPQPVPPKPAAAASRPAAPAVASIGGLKVVEVEKTEKASVARPERRGDYVFPSIDLLAEAPEYDGADDEQDYEHMMDLLIETLEQFNVKVEKEQVTTGPVITRYEVKPAPGVRVEKILSLDKNLALSLMADSVRILAPVPGRGTVGIEIPNKNPKAVCMREIVESRAWADSKAEIPVVLGKDVTGRPIVEDLTKMPHMLIAGSTGSGKTVCINSIIASLLYHAGPEDLRFIMVDPKVVEMQVYNALPHMLIPVVTEPKKVPGALKYLLNEMERRYRIFASVGVRNIAGFNKKLAKDKEERERLEQMEREQAASLSIEERAAAAEIDIEVPRDEDVFEMPTKKLPYIVCIIDELADLMMVAPQDIETGVARLAQLARAAGIHLILATQRPSVNVITGVIKANLPTRISFKVASKVDSRTILDQMGADALIGRGDMLFIPPGTSNLVRAQGAFVSDEEINAIVEYLRDKNGEPEYAAEVQAEIEAGGEDGNGGGAAGEYDDELVPQAIEIIRTHQRASTSFLQRKLKIGYNRAARIMDILEEEGIVGPDNGPSSPREIMD